PLSAERIPRDSAQVVAAEMEQALVEMLDAFYPRVVDSLHGGFLSTFDADWNPQGEQEKMIVTQSRYVWTASRASIVLEDRRDYYLNIASHGFAFLRDKMWDAERGGFVTLVSREGQLLEGPGGYLTGKTSYGNAFAIYALAAYYDASQNEEALSLARRAFQWLDQSAHDPEFGGYFQFISDEGRPIRQGVGTVPPKDQNSSIHLLEAFTELYRVWPDKTLKKRLSEMLRLVRDTIASEEGYLRLFFDAEWNPVSFRDSSEAVQRANLSLDHVSYGHDIETAFLMDEAAHALQFDEALSLLKGKVMVDHALKYGWDQEFGGFFDGGYYFDPAGPPENVMDGKIWWVQAEGLNALLLMAERFPNDRRRYFDRFVKQWRYVKAYLIDHDRGGWFWAGLDREPERRDYLKAHMWKGPYHDGRALMNCSAILRYRQAMAQLRLPRLIGDGMVIQRNAEIPVWGWAAPGTTVTARLAGHQSAAETDESGSWSLTLPALDVGGPHTLSIVTEDEGVQIEDVLVGDVWVASGQSNMEWVLRDATNAQEEMAGAADSMIRHFKVPRSWSYAPETELAGGEWVVMSPETSGDFTAVGYFFAEELRKHMDVPIGIINTTWGGSAIEAWISAGSMGMTDEELAGLEDHLRAEAEQAAARLKSRIGDFPESDAGLVDGVAHWADPDMDDSDWALIPVPSLWESAGYDGMDGVAWYRTTVHLTPEEAAHGATLGLGPIDDSDITWVNGRQVGSMVNAYSRQRLYSLSASVLRPGENTIAVRVEDTGGGGGIYGDPALIFLEVAGARKSLTGDWKFKPSQVVVNLDDRKHHTPTLLFNKMLAPLFNVPVAGAIWYQGETNAWDSLAFVYRDMLKAMVGDWRSGWKLDNMPFFVVQLPNYMEVKPQPSESGWAMIRESQLRILDLPKTGVAVTIDVGEAG
ncbi:MAG TPA: AGE family epimerase/isomerase, partial [Rhodothermia bacterium]